MRLGERIKLIISHPIGFILLWITSFGLIAYVGKILEPHAVAISSESAKILLIHLSSIFAVLCAIAIITGFYKTTHLANLSSKTLKISLIPVLVVLIGTIFLVRMIPSSIIFILLNGMGMIALAFVLGELLSREVIHPGHLIPVALVLALVDFWSVGQGPSSEIAKHATEFTQSGGYEQDLTPPWSMFLLLRYPQLITSEIYSFLGIGDLVILSFFVGCIHRFNLPRVISYSSLILGPVIAVIIANALSQGIPALPVIAVLFIAVNIRNLPLKKQDLFVSLIVLFVLIVIVLFLKFRQISS